MKKPSKALIDKWYDKLEAAGFEDIEERHSPREMLKRKHNHDFKKIEPDMYEAKRFYFQEAADMLNWHKFRNARERKIWALHAEGLSVREVATKIKLAKSEVHRIILRLRREIICSI